MRGRHRSDGNLQPLPGQLLHQANKAPVQLRRPAQQISRRHAHIVKKQLRGVLRLQAQLFQPLPHRKARHAALHQQQAGALGACIRLGLGHHDHQVSVPAVGDKSLAALEQVAAIGLHQGRGPDALQVRAGRGLTHGDGANHVATGQARQQPLFLLIGAVVEQVGRHDFVVQAKANARKARCSQRLELQHRVKFVGTGAAILLWQAHAQKAVGSRLVPDCPVDIALLLPSRMKRRNFARHEALETVTKCFVLGVKQGSLDHGVWG